MLFGHVLTRHNDLAHVPILHLFGSPLPSLRSLAAPSRLAQWREAYVYFRPIRAIKSERRTNAGYASGFPDFVLRARISAVATQIRKPIIIAIVASDWVTPILRG